MDKKEKKKNSFRVDNSENPAAKKQVEEGLFYQRVFMQGPFAFQSLDEQGYLINVNPFWLKILGYSSEEVLGRNFADFLDSEGKRDFKKNFAGFKKAGVIENVSFRLHHRQGHYVPVAFSGVIDCYPDGSFRQTLCVFRDISEIRNAEKELRESEARYRLLVENQNDLVVQVDREKRIVFANPVYCRTFGKKMEELQGKVFFPRIHEEDREQVNQTLDRAFTPPYKSQHEERALTTEGWKWFEWSARGVVEKNGNVSSLISVGRDIDEQKKAQLALRESETKNRAILEALPDLMFLQHANGTFLAYNAPLKKDLFVSESEFIGKKPEEVFPPELAGRMQASLSRAIEQDRMQVLSYEMLLNGEERFFEARIVRCGKDRALSLIRDITIRMRIENALRQSEMKFRQIVQHMTVGIVRVSLDFKIESTNEALCRMLGYSEKELTGLFLSDITHPEVLTENLSKQTQLANGEIDHFRMEKKFIHKNGSVLHGILDASLVRDGMGQPEYFIGSVLDITERKKIEDEFRENRRQLETLMDNLPGMAFRCKNDPQWTMKFVSEGAKALTGYCAADLIDNSRISFGEIVYPEDRDALWEHIQENLSAHRKYQMTYRIITADKNVKWVWEQGQGIFDKQGNLLALEGLVNDITENKKAESEKARIEEQLHQVKKLESVGRLAGGVAHDLNNLLSPIIGYSEMLLEEKGTANEFRDSLSEILNAGNRARNLVLQLLAFSRKQTLEFKQISVNSLLLKFEKLLRRTIREDISLEFRLSENLPFIKGDAGQLEQVIMNLAINARDAMPNGGKLIIATSTAELDSHYASTHRGVLPGDYVLLSVTDNGSGMDEITRSHVFEPFFTTKEKDKGTGLGLATVYGIVKQHGGNIWVYSEPEMGTTFKVYLPVFSELPESSLDEKLKHADHMGNETILLVEDNHQVRILARAMLEKRGYKVIEAADGGTALTLAGNCEETIHMLLTDVVMPEMNGKQLYERMLEKFPDIRVLFMSGYSEEVIAQRGILQAGLHFIQKPFSIKSLTTKIREVLNHSE